MTGVRQPLSPRAAIVCGALAGALGTAAMTAWQTLSSKLQSAGEPDSQSERPPDDPWVDAPAPAKVAKRISEGVFDRPVPADAIPLLSNAMHWAYGTGWGTLYGLAVAGRRGPVIRRGLIFGSLVWTSSYLELVPMGIYQPPWQYKASEASIDLSYHLVYGLGVALTFSVIEP